MLTILFASRTSAAPELARIRGLTFATIDRESVRASWDRREVIATVVILALVASVYLYFSFWV